MSDTAVRLVVFDLDDTLYLERHYAQSGFEAADRFLQTEFGTNGFAAVCWQLFNAGVRGTIFDRALIHIKLHSRPGLLDRLIDVYRTHTPEIELLPDAVTCLEHLRDRVWLRADHRWQSRSSTCEDSGAWVVTTL